MSVPPWTLSTQLSVLAVVVFAAMCAGWLWQRRQRNAGIVDVLWASSLAFAALLMGATGAGSPAARLAVSVLGGLWGSRLAWHLWRRVRGEAEDGRYRYLRAHWHGHQGKFFLFFQGQTLLVLLFALPFAAVAAAPGDALSPWFSAGVAIWVAALLGESLADAQLARFRAIPANRGKTCREGLWRYSRHPNYFFEWLHWFAYPALAVGSPLAWLAWLGPVAMYVFLRWLSGIPFTEAQALRTRGDDYRDYQRSTPALIPWFPRSPDRRSGS